MLLVHLETMSPLDTRIAISIPQLLRLLLLLPPLVLIIAEAAHKNVTRRSTSSLWLRDAINPRQTGCWNRPWICNEGKAPPRIKKRCCRNQCVDVASDVYNCGLCGFRCPFTWQCCRGVCINTNINPLHCGKCEHKCPFRSFCVYGMCGYAQPLPPFPFPPKPPKPPFPFPPKPPKPPFPPKPPHPPKDVVLHAPAMA